ncbi:MAG: DUF2695 domain-containing protein [Hyphomonadaceae bacterium]|nr:DUF2695 domain-containing protein [Hyphomonadaceae bacterium]
MARNGHWHFAACGSISSSMSSKDPEQRRKLNEWKAEQRAKAEAELPAPKETLLGLFEELNERLSSEPCDHSLRFTLAWADSKGIDGTGLVEWTRKHGGYCDCEVLGNVPDANPAFGR